MTHDNQTSRGSRGADLLVDAMIEAGITELFGVPGDTGVVFYDALDARRDEITHVLARDERHAAYMADGYARATGRLGVCEASSGGGVSYIVGGLAEAYSSSVPVLVVTSDIHSGSRGTGALTELDQLAFFAAVTKWRGSPESAEQIPALVAEAVGRATSGRPGPVAIVVPEDILDAIADDPSSVPRSADWAAGQTDSAAAQHDDFGAQLDAAAEALTTASQPLILAGGGVHQAKAYEQLTAVAEAAGIPVATSIHGKGAIDENGDWSLGVIGANGARDFANAYAAGADVALLVGTRANATDTHSYTMPPRSTATVFAIDIEAERAGRNYPGSTPLVGDAAGVLGALAARLQEREPAGAEARRDRIAAERTAWQRRTDQLPVTQEAGLLEPRQVTQRLHELFGADALVVADPGTPTPNVASYWPASSGARRVIVPRGHGPMGYAIPASIGVATAFPDQPVLCLTTEGSLAMSAGDWESAVRLGVNVTYVLLDNNSMGWIKMLQHLYEGKRYFGVDPGAFDNAAVAAAFGMPADRASSLDDLAALVDKAIGTPGPSMIEVMIPDEIASVPPVAPWEDTIAGRVQGRPVY